jgi:hypothetical protein
MANNTFIQIKRSTTTASPTSLLQGEMAWSNATQVLYIGNPDASNTVTAIAGARNPGVLTANQALVVNSSSAIDKIIVANLQPTGIYANGSLGTAGQTLLSNGTSTYWGTGTSGANTQVQFNDSGVANASAGFTFNKTTNNLFVGNTITVGTGFTANSTLVNAAAINVTNQVNTATLYATTSANIASIVQANSTGLYVATGGNIQSANGLYSVGSFSGTYTDGIVVDYTTGHGRISVGTADDLTFYTGNVAVTAMFMANSTGLYETGVVNAVSYNTGSGFGTATATGGAIVNTSVVAVGNSTVNAYINSSALVIGGNPIANSTGANNAFYLGGVAAASYVQNTDSRVLSGNLSFTGANVTFSGANLTVTGTNTYISSNQYFAGATHYVAANATFGANVTMSGANVVISGTNTAISSNVTITGSSITASSSDLTIRNITASGNLIVSGSVVSINVSTIVVNDNIIELADNNITTDAVDTGWYSPAGNGTSVWYSGLVRQASKSSNNNPYFWLFGSNTNPNTATTVDTSSNSVTATLQAYLAPYGVGGAFIANSTAISITANSTVSVSLTANSLSLVSPLAATSGGTGQNTYAAGDLLYSGSVNPSSLSKLSIGSNGQVLQINSNLPAWGGLDGGTF